MAQISRAGREPESHDSGIARSKELSYMDNLYAESASSWLRRIPVPFAVIDSFGYVVEYNDLFSALFDFAAADALNEKSIRELVATKSQGHIESLLDSHVKAEGSRLSECPAYADSEPVWFARRDKSMFPARVYLKPFIELDGNSTGTGIVIIDETSGYNTIARLENEREDLKKREQFKNDFVAVASHELRTPIQPILGFALLASRGIMSQEQAWEGVLAEARRLQQLANDILDVSRIDSGALDYKFQPVRINEVVSSTLGSLTTDMKKSVVANIAVQEGIRDIEIEADKSRITQAISNVVGNAIKFTATGEVRVESRVFKDQNRVEVKVIDSGIGIAENIMPRLFSKFVTNNHGDAKSHGTGLGLYITRAIVTAHKGRISAHNNPDAGATFVIELPISRKVPMLQS